MKKKFAFIISLVLCLVLCISLVACNNKDNNGNNDGNNGGNADAHTPKSAWSSDATEHWHDCATEGHTDKLDKAAHTWNDGEVTTDPTEEADGVKTYTCTVCSAKKTEPVPKLTHTHTFDMTNWETNDTHHWHKATCAHTDEKNGYEEHKGDWTEKTPAGYGVNRVEKRTCTVCGKNQERTVENSALAAKDNTVTLKSGVAKVKTYDGQAVALSANDFTTNGNGAITFAYRVKGSDGEFSADAPKNAGVYEVKVSVAATAEWKACDITVEYTINKKVLVFETNDLTKTYDGTAKYTHNFTVGEGLVEGDVCSYSFDVQQRTTGTTSEPCINAGTYGYVISSNEVCDNDNYSVNNMTGLDSGEGTSLTVNKATISGLEISIKESELDRDLVDDFIDYTVKIAGKNITVKITYTVSDLMEGGDLLISNSETKRGYCSIEFDNESDEANFQFDANVVGTLTLIYDVIA